MFFFLGFIFLTGCEEEQVYVQKVAREDLDFMRQEITANHPGMVNVDDPQFKEGLERAYKHALAAIDTLKNRDDYARILRSFVDSFNDNHVRLFLKSDRPVKRKKGDFENFSFDEIAPRIGWLRIPTFDPNKDQQKQLNEMIDMMAHLRGYKAVVFDVHGNTGGNNEWGHRLVQALFTPAYADYKRQALWKNITVDYRVSKDNLAHIKSRADQFAREFGKEDPLTVGYQNFYNSMKDAYEKGEVSIQVPKGQEEQMAKVPCNPVKPVILVIVDGKCASATLDFIDELKCLNHPIILFGQKTAADTLYMDVREPSLPSGLGKFSFPIKVYRGRLRGNNQPYYPDFPYDGNLNDVKQVAGAVYQYILKLGIRN